MIEVSHHKVNCGVGAPTIDGTTIKKPLLIKPVLIYLSILA